MPALCAAALASLRTASPSSADSNSMVNFADITAVLTFFGLPCP